MTSAREHDYEAQGSNTEGKFFEQMTDRLLKKDSAGQGTDGDDT